MKRISMFSAVLNTLALATVPIIGGFLIWTLWPVRAAIVGAQQQGAVLSAKAGAVLDQANRDAVLSGKVIADARLSIDNINSAALDERFYFEHQLPAMMDQAHGILANVQTATAGIPPLLQETTARAAALAPVEDNAAALERDFDAQIRDPKIADALANIDAATAQLAITGRESAATMGSVQAMAADGQEEVHKMTHPKPLVSIADWTLKAVHALGGFF